MENVGLVLEGGGMRGVFTAGVLDYFMDQDLYFPYVIGMSSGACVASSYLSRQRDRNKIANIDYVLHPDFISVKNVLRKGQIFGMDFIFDELPNRLVPFDFSTFHQAEEQFIVGATDCETGEPVYFDKETYGEDFLLLIRASSSLPFMAPIVEYKGKKLLDGGIADPLPIKKSLADGNQKNVLVLTRNYGHRKKKPKYIWAAKRTYRQYGGLVKAIMTRHEKYNEAISYIEKLEKENQVFVIRPEEPLKVSRVERNKERLEELYEQGYNHAKRMFKDLMDYLEK